MAYGTMTRFANPTASINFRDDNFGPLGSGPQQASVAPTAPATYEKDGRTMQMPTGISNYSPQWQHIMEMPGNRQIGGWVNQQQSMANNGQIQGQSMIQPSVQSTNPTGHVDTPFDYNQAIADASVPTPPWGNKGWGNPSLGQNMGVDRSSEMNWLMQNQPQAFNQAPQAMPSTNWLTGGAAAPVAPPRQTSRTSRTRQPQQPAPTWSNGSWDTVPGNWNPATAFQEQPKEQFSATPGQQSLGGLSPQGQQVHQATVASMQQGRFAPWTPQAKPSAGRTSTNPAFNQPPPAPSGQQPSTNWLTGQPQTSRNVSGSVQRTSQTTRNGVPMGPAQTSFQQFGQMPDFLTQMFGGMGGGGQQPQAQPQAPQQPSPTPSQPSQSGGIWSGNPNTLPVGHPLNPGPQSSGGRQPSAIRAGTMDNLNLDPEWRAQNGMPPLGPTTRGPSGWIPGPNGGLIPNPAAQGPPASQPQPTPQAPPPANGPQRPPWWNDQAYGPWEPYRTPGFNPHAGGY